MNLNIVLIAMSILVCFFIFRKIRKSQFSINDTLYWLFFAVLLLIMSIFPKIPYFFSSLLGFEAPSNFIFVVMIFLLFVKIFLMSVKISSLENKLYALVQKYALDGNEGKKSAESEKKAENSPNE